MSYHSTTDIAERDFQDSRDHLMKKLSFFLRDNALVRFLTSYSEDQYHPEKHYMRGPGPKAKAKQDCALDGNKAFAENTVQMQPRR
jgi:hypothetical protein